MKDPFDDSLLELQALLANGRSLVATMSSRGVVVERQVEELKQCISGAEEELQLLQEVLGAVRQGKATATKAAPSQRLTGSTWLQREALVLDASNELYELQHAAKKILDYYEQQSQHKGVKGEPPSSSRQNNDGNDFMLAHEEEQRRLVGEQDTTLDRMHQGLGNIQNNALLMKGEMEKQDDMLETAHRQMDVLKDRLKAANDRVDYLLNNMSDCKKICIIVVLCLVLGFLAFSVL